MPQKDLSIINFTQGIFQDLTELLLFSLGTTVKEKAGRGYDLPPRKLVDSLHELIPKIEKQRLALCLNNAKSRGYLSSGYQLTSRGFNIVSQKVPVFRKSVDWDERWQGVLFKKTGPREVKLKEVLRSKHHLRSLASNLWIHPQPDTRALRNDIARKRCKESAIFISINGVANMQPKTLAWRLWDLSLVNSKYRKFIKNFESFEQRHLSKSAIFQGQFEYLLALSKDPLLPKDFLPLSWMGEEARKLYRELLAVLIR